MRGLCREILNRDRRRLLLFQSLLSDDFDVARRYLGLGDLDAHDGSLDGNAGQAVRVFATEQRCRMVNTPDDAGISRASTEIALEGLCDLLVGRIVVVLQQGCCCNHHPRRAVTTLQPMLGVEALLDHVEAI